MVTTESNKVYVGYVINTVDPSAERKACTLVPSVSGYRNEQHKVIFTTDYSFVTEQADQNPIEYEDFIVTVPIEKITSLRFFDLESYEKFQNNEPD